MSFERYVRADLHERQGLRPELNIVSASRPTITRMSFLHLSWLPQGSSRTPVLHSTGGCLSGKQNAAPKALSAGRDWCECTAPLDRAESGHCGHQAFSGVGKPWSFHLAQPPGNLWGSTECGCCLLMRFWAALCSEGFWSLHCGWEIVIKPSMSTPSLGNEGTVPGI